jgi:hypothetical protein
MEAKFKMIPVEALIDVLMEMYDLGVDYVDITGKQSPEQDSIGISFIKEYVDPDFLDNFEEDVPEIEIKNTDDLNDLT